MKLSHIKTDHVDKLLKRAHGACRANQRDYRVRQYLGSYDAKLRATRKAHDAMRPDRRPNEAKLEAIARDLNPWKGTDEPVLVHLTPKASHPHYRAVLEFGIKHRALQYLARDILIALLKLHPNQYGTCGGTHAAIRQTKQALRDGYLWAVELDIKDCFPSFDGKELHKLLPLPKEMIDKVIISGCLNLMPGNLLHYYGPEDDHEGDPIALTAALSSARRGIPQGSATSPLIAEAMVAIALKQVPLLGVIIAYLDNTLLLAKSENDVVCMTEALGAAFAQHPVGRLRPYPRVFKPGEPVEFLGHRLKRINGIVRIEPDDDNREKFEAEVKSEIAYLITATLPDATRAKRLERLEEYIRSWTANFKLCDDIEVFRAYWLGKAKWAAEA